MRQGGVDDHMDEIASFKPIVEKLKSSVISFPKDEALTASRLNKKDFVENMK